MESEIRKRMTLRPPQNEEVAKRMDKVRNSVIELVESIEDSCVPSREWSLAMTAFEEACFWAIASIARNQ